MNTMVSRYRTSYNNTTLVMIVALCQSHRINSYSFISRCIETEGSKLVFDGFRVNTKRSTQLLSVRRHSHSESDTGDFGRRQEDIRTRNSTISAFVDSWGDFEAPKSPNDISSNENRVPSSGNNDRSSRRQPWSNTPQKPRLDLGRSSSYGSRPFDSKASQLETSEDKINMRLLESSGFIHLYGLNPVLSALTANRRDLESNHKDADSSMKSRPETQLTPYLFVQEKLLSKRSVGKANISHRILELANIRKIPVAIVDKGILNTLSENRPHQGFVLRCGKYNFEPISDMICYDQNLWLILDEIVDPQNLGAIIRTARFLGDVKVLVCAKNSAPPSATVSAASSGALEATVVYSTNNLPKTLATAEQQGFRIIGASSGLGSDDSDCPVYDLPNLPERRKLIDGKIEPTVLVLGNEGHGLRHLVMKSCTEFVRIPGTTNDSDLDSLNVSVSCGILLWQLLQRKPQE